LTNDIIKFLNNGTKEHLKDLNVNDRTNIIIDAKKVLTKIRFMQNFENILYEMIGEVASFKNNFTELIKIGFQPPWDGNGDILPQNKYKYLLEKSTNNNNRFDKLQEVLLGKDVIEMSLETLKFCIE
jgi:hypothetical protein